MEAVINKLSAHRRTRLTCEVRETNLTAQLFLKSLGFKATRVIRNFYKDFNEDAYHMQYRLNEKASVACEESY
jgi:ribosomal-protein-alanine N-acetyltransferase